MILVNLPPRHDRLWTRLHDVGGFTFKIRSINHFGPDCVMLVDLPPKYVRLIIMDQTEWC